MEKFIPYEKLSKKEKRLRNFLRRGSWQGVNPVTRKSENPKAYNRARVRQSERTDGRAYFFALHAAPPRQNHGLGRQKLMVAR